MEAVSQVRQSAGFRLMVLFILFCIGLILTGLVQLCIQGAIGTGNRTVLLCTSVVQCVLAFCIPAYIAARYASDNPLGFLHLTHRPALRALAGVVIVYIITLPAMNYLIDWNRNLHFPGWAAGLEQVLRGWEETNGKVGQQILDCSGLGEMIVGIIVVGLLTGLSEEVFFRGALQRILREGTAGKWLAVWLAAAIFSAIHFQFFGFVPRLLMGAFFGYLVVTTSSLWTAAFAHALNNSMVVVAAYLFSAEAGNAIDNFGIETVAGFPMFAILSTVAGFIFFMRFRRYFFNSKTN